MKQSFKEKSQFVQQMCQHINKLQATNINLHEQISIFQQQKMIVYRALGYTSWEDLVYRCKNGNKNLSKITHYGKQNSPLALKKTGFMYGDGEYSQTTSYYDNSPHKTTKNLRNNHSRQKSIIDKLQDITKQQNNHPQYHTMKSNKKLLPYHNSNYATHKNLLQPSPFQSPIQSQSRIVQKSIRGNTDRSQNIDFIQNFIRNKQKQTLFNSTSNKNTQNTHKIDTIDNIGYYKQYPNNKQQQQQQMMLLSIQNTKLRQKINKLQAIIQSKEISQKYNINA